MAELIFEIGCEEMPARFVAPAMEQIKAKGGQELARQGLLEEGAEVLSFGTPRRLWPCWFVAETAPGRQGRTGPGTAGKGGLRQRGQPHQSGPWVLPRARAWK